MDSGLAPSARPGMTGLLSPLVPAEAGTQLEADYRIPAYAGMSGIYAAAKARDDILFRSGALDRRIFLG
jgi:hypothetical protein